MGKFLDDKRIEEFISWKAAHAERAAVNYKFPLQLLSRKTTAPLIKLNIQDVTSHILGLKGLYTWHTLNTHIAAFKQFYTYYNGIGMTSFPVAHIKRGRKPHQQPKVANNFIVEKVLHVLDEYEFWQLRDKVMIRILRATGMRVSELASLNVDQIIIQERYTKIITCKSKKPRIVLWDEETHRLLIQYLGTRVCMREESPALFIGNSPTSLRLTTRSIERIFVNLCDFLGVERFSPHTLRHKKGHDVYRKTMDIKAVQETLGHSKDNPTASFQYTDLNENEQVALLERVL